MEERDTEKIETIRPTATDAATEAELERAVRPRSNVPLLVGLGATIAVFAGLLVWTMSVHLPVWTPGGNYSTLGTPAPPGAKLGPNGPEAELTPSPPSEGPAPYVNAPPMQNAQPAASPPERGVVVQNPVDAEIRNAATQALRDCGTRQYPDAFEVAVTFWPDGTVKDAVVLDPEFAKTESGTCVKDGLGKLVTEPFGAPSPRTFLEDVHPDQPAVR